MTNTTEITAEQIKALRAEAAQAGERDLVDCCNFALADLLDIECGLVLRTLEIGALANQYTGGLPRVARAILAARALAYDSCDEVVG